VDDEDAELLADELLDDPDPADPPDGALLEELLSLVADELLDLLPASLLPASLAAAALSPEPSLELPDPEPVEEDARLSVR